MKSITKVGSNQRQAQAYRNFCDQLLTRIEVNLNTIFMVSGGSAVTSRLKIRTYKHSQVPLADLVT